MTRNRAVLTAAATAACILASIACAPALWQSGAGPARPAIEAAAVHYAPAENLEHIDVGLIDRAKASIDMAAYVLTDWAVIQALVRAADRGVAVRVYLDGGQFGARDLKQPFLDLKVTPGVQIKAKPPGGPLMHFKAYQIDGRVLRTGSANFSPSGLKRQDNDLVVIESHEVAEAFRRNFERVFAAGEAL
jgi:phosphatidylserine/phosphatidylglycerophosphate/cardiolipin synthase-like enzyme